MVVSLIMPGYSPARHTPIDEHEGASEHVSIAGLGKSDLDALSIFILI